MEDAGSTGDGRQPDGALDPDAVGRGEDDRVRLDGGAAAPKFVQPSPVASAPATSSLRSAIVGHP